MGYQTKGRLTLDEYSNGILNGNKIILSKAITLIESNLKDDHNLAGELIEKVLPNTGKSLRIGITGVPGVGKSTFIEAFGEVVTGFGKKITVLAIDPSSQKTKGSILGDKTRMEKLAGNPLSYIRPSATGLTLGGVGGKTRETILICEAAGYEVIIIETVGVGQSETAVHNMVDFFLLLMLAGAGDELQGIKKGIMEMADAIVINKADGENVRTARQAKATYENALHLFQPAESGWQPPVLTCSSLERTGLSEIWKLILEHQLLMQENGYFEKNRNHQNIRWMYETIRLNLEKNFYDDPKVKEIIPRLERQIINKELAPITAARKIFEYSEIN
ncbi:methylmalonyl Co-A mutase-associated GTPase MeaB [soil metagenome]